MPAQNDPEPNLDDDPGAFGAAPRDVMHTDFKSRLYERYLAEQTGFTQETVQDAIRMRLPYLRRVIASCIPSNKSANILDLGCGYGSMLWALRSVGYTSLVGVDVSPQQIDAARRLGFEHVYCQDIVSFLSSAPDEKLSVIIAFDVLEHFTRPELFALMGELRRVLEPGGRLIVHVPNGAALSGGAVLYGDLSHELAFTERSLKQLASASSFKVIKVMEDAPVAHGAKSLVRSAIWFAGTLPFRLLALAEWPGAFSTPLSRNLLAVLERV
jgi:predicted TPR repeat methyltransferase